MPTGWIHEHTIMIRFSIRLLVYNCIFNFALSDMADDVKYVCGGINTCSDGRNNSLPSDSCCRPCECDKICLEKGICCSDMETISDIPGKVIKQECLPSIKYSTLARAKSLTERFYVRAKCPEIYMDRQIRNNCETGQPESLEDIPFVSSKSGKIVYKNRHCAECHGEKDAISWKLVIDWFCIIQTAFTINNNASSFAETLMTACSLPFMRPSITQWKPVVCHEEKDLISSCSHARSHDQSSDNITKELQKMCANDKSALTVYAANNARVYANVYCYLCNKRSRARAICDSDMQNEKYFRNMYFLLNFSPIIEAAQNEAEYKERGCDHQDFYDMYFETCRRIHCPYFEVLSQGRCASVIDYSRLNYGFNFVFVPEAANRLNQSGVDIGYTAEELSKLITLKLRLESCLICSISVRSKSHDLPTKSVTLLYVIIVFTTSPHCERELLLSTAAKLEAEEKANNRLTIAIGTLSFHIEYVPSYETFTRLKRNSIFVYGYKTCIYLDPSKFGNCPKVTLTEEEYKTVVNQDQLANVQAARSNQGFEVCLDEYKFFSNAQVSKGKRTIIFRNTLIPFTVLVVRYVATMA